MYYVYLLVSKIKNKTISYVGYAKDIKKRLKLHNNSKGAKFTRGRRWKLAYYKKYDLNEIVRGDSIFCATGITSGDLVSGVKVTNDNFITETLVTHKNSTINIVKKEIPIT